MSCLKRSRSTSRIITGLIHALTFRRFILDQILSGDATEIVVQNIHEYLTTVGDNVRSGK